MSDSRRRNLERAADSVDPAAAEAVRRERCRARDCCLEPRDWTGSRYWPSLRIWLKNAKHTPGQRPWPIVIAAEVELHCELCGRTEVSYGPYDVKRICARNGRPVSALWRGTGLYDPRDAAGG